MQAHTAHILYTHNDKWLIKATTRCLVVDIDKMLPIMHMI